MSSSLNIIVFGETGVGKSSMINMIAGRDVAKVSSDVNGCTMSYSAHYFSVNGRPYYIWDTVGLEEQGMGVNGFLVAIAQAYELIGHLSRQGGIDLLLFCMRGGRITATTQSNYRLFYEVLCGSSVPIALVFTGLEREANLEDWWERNWRHIEAYGIKSMAHACITAVNDPENREVYLESQQKLIKLLEGRNGDGRFAMPPEKWFVGFLRRLKLFAPSSQPGKKGGKRKKNLMRVLTKRCNLDTMMAEELAILLLADR